MKKTTPTCIIKTEADLEKIIDELRKKFREGHLVVCTARPDIDYRATKQGAKLCFTNYVPHQVFPNGALGLIDSNVLTFIIQDKEKLTKEFKHIRNNPKAKETEKFHRIEIQ